MSYICTSCGKEYNGEKIYPNKLCQGCYNYFDEIDMDEDDLIALGYEEIANAYNDDDEEEE